MPAGEFRLIDGIQFGKENYEQIVFKLQETEKQKKPNDNSFKNIF